MWRKFLLNRFSNTLDTVFIKIDIRIKFIGIRYQLGNYLQEFIAVAMH